MTPRTRALAGVCIAMVIYCPSWAASNDIQPDMRAVTCVYRTMRSHPGALSVGVYSVSIGKEFEKYVVEFSFRHNDATLEGDLGIYPDELAGNAALVTNDSPRGQDDNQGNVELDFIGNKEFQKMASKCNLGSGFDDSVHFVGEPDPIWAKIKMPK